MDRSVWTKRWQESWVGGWEGKHLLIFSSGYMYISHKGYWLSAKGFKKNRIIADAEELARLGAVLTCLSSDFIQSLPKHWSPKGSFPGKYPQAGQVSGLSKHNPQCHLLQLQLCDPPLSTKAWEVISESSRGFPWLVTSGTCLLYTSACVVTTIANKSMYFYFKNISSSS